MEIPEELKEKEENSTKTLSYSVKRQPCPCCGVENAPVTTVKFNELVTLSVCGICNSVLRKGRAECNSKMIDRLKLPETNNDYTICPMCWRQLELDQKRWRMVCPNPCCSYSKRAMGLSLDQRKLKKEYMVLRDEIIAKVMKGEEVTKEEESRYAYLESVVKSYKKYEAEFDK